MISDEKFPRTRMTLRPIVCPSTHPATGRPRTRGVCAEARLAPNGVSARRWLEHGMTLPSLANEGLEVGGCLIYPRSQVGLGMLAPKIEPSRSCSFSVFDFGWHFCASRYSVVGSVLYYNRSENRSTYRIGYDRL
jgi:hypothetical protein